MYLPMTLLTLLLQQHSHTLMQQPFFQERLLNRVFIRLLIHLKSSSRILEPDVVGEEHYETVRKTCSGDIYRSIEELQDIIAILGMEELSDEDKAYCIQSKKGSEIPFSAILCSRNTSQVLRDVSFLLKETIRRIQSYS